MTPRERAYELLALISIAGFVLTVLVWAHLIGG